ncbi:MAG: 5-formyltetrahydrofolate cyclo-ligase [Oscillatoriales cyanobacterium]|nr:MAG: 5-formyltetrahydrofolate cyclo-ligase [Oscillatoriales cyanobacterium]
MSNLDPINLEKRQLRQHFLRQRQQLDRTQWLQKSEQICQNLRQMPAFQQARSILAFTSFRQEPDLSSLYGSTVSSDGLCTPNTNTELAKQWGFSRCVGDTLVWHHYQPGHVWIHGAYGICEPAADWPEVDLSQVDLILVPAVACDRSGGRLGYGGGFYDRFLAQMDHRSIVTIGIIFSFAYCEQLPVQAWDRSLDFVCTETAIEGTTKIISIR